MSVLVSNRGAILPQCRWLDREEVVRNNGPFDTVRNLVCGDRWDILRVDINQSVHKYLGSLVLEDPFNSPFLLCIDTCLGCMTTHQHARPEHAHQWMQRWERWECEENSWGRRRNELFKKKLTETVWQQREKKSDAKEREKYNLKKWEWTEIACEHLSLRVPRKAMPWHLRAEIVAHSSTYLR